MSANYENATAWALGTIGAVKGLYEVYKPTDSIETAEAIGLVIGVGGAALTAYFIYRGIKENGPFITMDR